MQAGRRVQYPSVLAVGRLARRSSDSFNCRLHTFPVLLLLTAQWNETVLRLKGAVAGFSRRTNKYCARTRAELQERIFHRSADICLRIIKINARRNWRRIKDPLQEIIDWWWKDARTIFRCFLFSVLLSTSFLRFIALLFNIQDQDSEKKKFLRRQTQKQNFFLINFSRSRCWISTTDWQ